MSTQLLTEIIMISTMFILTIWALTKFSQSQQSKTATMAKLLTGVLATFLIMAGTAKFFDPFNSMFWAQITYSDLPFPALSRWLGQLGEIGAGVFFLLVLLPLNISKRYIKELVFAGTVLTNIIMLVAVYVHLLPQVPAEVLPLQSKPPVMTLIIIGLVLLNLFLHNKAGSFANRNDTKINADPLGGQL